MDELTEGQLNALNELARKKSGEAIGFLTIADARTLTDLGLARRAHSGWEITPAGLALIGGPTDPGR
ncbi:MAG: hypothetical protein JWO83_1689 [Caulobacteraceae bacterium]|jgi:hypothetical protein|nr:hypothetical protein [Caulobacteraceae bacterium]